MGLKYPMKYCLQKGDDGGAFRIPFEGRDLHVIASHGGGWEHVSVSLSNRNPNWREMSFIKDLFWEPDDCVIQYHPPKKDYVNLCDTCLHLWRPIDIEIPLPPQEFV